ncbi:MAG: CinA family protein [Deltaproteobacteria bacterium]|jgi:PncC family amidohydrolase|nr:CinA family protein [Deltaproteobacteria bacterium]
MTPSLPGFEKDFEPLKSLSKAIGEALRADSKTLAAAESLTGGWITAALTSVPGSSDYLMGGICAYSNEVKAHLLGVCPETLAVYGAVSAQCSKEMARGARLRIGADLAVSSTGIAGPSGGSSAKPVGLVYLTVLDSSRFVTVEKRFAGDRLAVTFQAAAEALRLLSEFLRPSQTSALEMSARTLKP